MKSLVKNRVSRVKAKVAQCCAKISRTIAGCHD